MSKLRSVIHLLLTTPLNNSEVARSANVSRATVARYRRIALEKGSRWSDLQLLLDEELDAMFNKAWRRLTRRRMADFAWVHTELQRPGVTLLLLWEEYCAQEPANALSYSQFTEHYRRYRKRIDRVMRQSHHPGEKCFVDFSGRKPGYTNPDTGEWTSMDLFVGALGCSNLTYATCVPQQTVPHWIAAHTRMFEYFGGVPAILVPDNLKAAVLRPGANFIANPSYVEMAEHYGTTILPTRTYRPRDKAKVEGAVLIAQRWIVARLRNQNFFSPDELNTAVAALVEELNQRPFSRLPGCRASRYADMERDAMQPLPAQRYEFGEWTAPMRVDNGYHVRVNQHWYSVPHRLVGERVSVRSTAAVVEIFHQHTRVASHLRDDTPGTLTTDPQHQPDAHRAYAERTPESFLAWAKQIGPATTEIVRAQFERAVPALGLPACSGLRKLVMQHGATEVEAAACRAVEIRSLTVKSVKSLLNTRRHRREGDEDIQGDLPLHANLRGPDYYAKAVEDTSC
ncbi:IS21 family transposase [Dyella agri]|uniref:IS21 family transposase n=1 Tax=Dyella agri TaxID=1926869 RepID=A0ABW8KKV9_9GAMM